MNNDVKTVQLGEIVEIKVGYQSRSKISADDNGLYKLIQAKDFDNNSRKLLHNDIIRFQPERNPGHYTISKGDLLFLSRGIDNFAYYVDENLKNTLVSGSLYLIRVKSDVVLPQYIVWWLNSKESQDYLQSRSGGSTISFISKSVLQGMNIPLPPLEKQKQVVMVIDLWEKERSIYDRLLKTKAKLVEALCKNAVKK